MKRNLLTMALLASSLSAIAQNVICHVDPNGIFYVGESALVYNGGGLQTKGSGIYDIHGNVMVVGASGDVFKTLDAAGTGNKLDGGNIILRMNPNPALPITAASYANFATATYGQLYINGIAQGSITGIVDKEFRTPKHGTGNYFQQIALPFYKKTLSTLSTEFAKAFGTTRWTQNEILKWDNRNVVSKHFTSLAWQITDPGGYYMLGSKADNLDTSTPPPTMVANSPTPAGSVYTLRGVPFASGVVGILKDAGAGINFGTGGNAVNQYNEKYNTYIQDRFDFSTGAWVGNYGRNIYQFGNPFFTNLDLSRIGYIESAAIGDSNQLLTIQGIQYDPGTVKTESGGSTYFTSAQIQNFVLSGPNRGTIVGDVDLVIKPMQVFTVKLTNGTATDAERTLNFDNLRRFNYNSRAAGTNYHVTANKGTSSSTETVKQLGVIGLDTNGNEIARAYYVVYPNAISGHPTQATTQATNSSTNLMGTFEEDAVNGGYDKNYINSYWLYVNEANEVDFKGKAIPLNLYSPEIKSLKFEVRENAELIEDNIHNLSTGIGFYYKSATGVISEVAQNQVVPVTGDQYNLYYGKNLVLATEGSVKPSRTMVVYNGAIDKFVIRFDPSWKKSDINVYDLSGKLVISQKDVLADKDFEINLAKINSGYIVTAVSEKGEKISSKIIR